ncbi:MAG TPA: hypothetical protein VH640_14695, partial [Bryobacteraceae bacterium]|jgi:putative aminopeptidase FrvX
LLLDEVAHLKSSIPASKEKLRARFSGACQLVVSWRGRPSDKRRAVLIAHVDQEGFLVREFDRSGRYAYCWHTSAEAPDMDLVRGSEVRLVAPDKVVRGKVEEVREVPSPTSGRPFNHEVRVGIEDRSRVRNPRIIKNEYFEGYGNYELPAWVLKDGMISATHVDNVAGVSVLVALLNAMVRNNWRVNADFLFTTCEEAGFCGVVAEILDAGGETLAGQTDGDIVCIVVDSSSSVKFCETRLWTDEVYETGWAPAEIELRCPVVRTADLYGVFDPEVAKLLYSAAASVQAAAGRHDRICWSGRRRPSVAEKRRGSLKKEGAEPSGPPSKTSVAVGAMRGGWCEATPLSLQGSIRRLAGLEPLRLRCGAIAIPISDYRNVYRKERHPEMCHEDALRGACELLGEAVHLCHRWPFGLRANGAARTIPKEQEILKKLMHWQQLYGALSSVTNCWVEQAKKRGEVS